MAGEVDTMQPDGIEETLTGMTPANIPPLTAKIFTSITVFINEEFIYEEDIHKVNALSSITEAKSIVKTWAEQSMKGRMGLFSSPCSTISIVLINGQRIPDD